MIVTVYTDNVAAFMADDPWVNAVGLDRAGNQITFRTDYGQAQDLTQRLLYGDETSVDVEVDQSDVISKRLKLRSYTCDGKVDG